MSDLIDAGTAQQMLGCDEATLSNYINNASLRAQRVDGQLMIHREDVEAMLSGGGQGESSDSILVLDGESEDLSIDLGEVVDDGAATMVESSPRAPTNTEQITFGEELEVVNFDDPNTAELSDDTEATISFDESSNTENLNFTDSNTAVLTDVDETMTASVTSDYQTVESDEYTEEQDELSAAQASVRRSVRSQRVRPAPIKVHPIFPLVAALTLAVAAAVIAPIYAVSLWPKEQEYHYNGDRAWGMDDNVWTQMTESVIGFSVEPDAEKFRKLHPDREHLPITAFDPAQVDRWRWKEYLNGDTDRSPKLRARDFFVSEVQTTEGPEGELIPDKAIIIDENGERSEFEFKREEVDAGNDSRIPVYKPVIRYR